MDTYISSKIDSKYIYYKCNYCVRLNNKLGSEENIKKYDTRCCGYHIYNSDNNFTNRELRLKNHCLFSDKEWIKLIVNKKTLKII